MNPQVVLRDGICISILELKQQATQFTYVTGSTFILLAFMRMSLLALLLSKDIVGDISLGYQYIMHLFEVLVLKNKK